jgi:hypothetical protein
MDFDRGKFGLAQRESFIMPWNSGNITVLRR